MFVYKITFLGGSTVNFRANSPKEAYERAKDQYKCDVVFVKFVR